VVFSKLDLLGEQYTPEIRTDDAFGVFSISAAGRLELQPLIDAWWGELQRQRRELEREHTASDFPLP
jgi:hypothetical protein